MNFILKMLKHHINLSPNNIIYKILKNKQKNKSWACPAASGTQDCTYGEMFANKIKLFFSEIFKNYWHILQKHENYVKLVKITI